MNGSPRERNASPDGEPASGTSLEPTWDAASIAVQSDGGVTDAAKIAPDAVPDAREADAAPVKIDAGTDASAGTDPPCANALLSDERLYRGEYRCSPDGVYRFGISLEGDLVLLRRGVPVWSANVCCSAHRVAMQSDGNLVVRSSNNAPLLASNTDGHPGARLTVENDGRAVIWFGANILWSTAR